MPEAAQNAKTRPRIAGELRKTLSREEVFVQMEYMSTGREGERSSEIREYWDLSPEEGYRRAREHMQRARLSMENAVRDWAYLVAIMR